MNKYFKANIDERPAMIALGIFTLYALVAGFVLYLLFLHRISTLSAILWIVGISLIYTPRFIILFKLNKKDKIEIIEDYLMINGEGINLADIKKFRVKESKPQIIFFMNARMIMFQEAEFHLLLSKGEISFKAIGSEKIKLLKEFLHTVVGNI